MRRFWRGLGRRAAALLARLGLLQPGKIMYIGGSGTLPTPLTREEEAQVIARLEQGDEEARQTLIERNLRLVVYIARRFENTGVNIEDLISIGTIGLIKAVGTYRSVGVDRGLLLAVRVDQVQVGEEDRGPMLAALSPTPVSDGGGYRALLGAD